MVSRSFNIDNKDVVRVTNKLEKMHRSSLPISIRGALNDAAYDMYSIGIEKHFLANNFIIRAPKFLKSHSRFNKSPNTFDINNMESSAGIISGKSKSGDQLEFQERGGTISNRGAIPTDEVRISKSPSKRIKKDKYYNLYKGSSRGVVSKNSKRTIIRTDKSLIQIERNGKWKTLYRLRGSVIIKKNPFIEPAGIEASKKIPEFYVKQAERRIK